MVHAAFGPIGTDRPAPVGGSVANTQPPNSFFQGHSPPYPTNDWWVGFGAGDGQAVVAGPYPYQSNLNNNSILFGISTKRDFDGVSIHQPTQNDWSVGFVEHSSNPKDRKAVSWDSQSVTLQYFTGSSSLTSYLVPGSPYLTFKFDAATPLFTSQQGLITSFGGKAVVVNGAAVAVSGTKFKVVNTAGTYVIYSLNGSITLSASAANGGGTIRASTKFSGVLRVVKLNTAGHEALLDQRVATYPTGVSTDYSVAGDTGTLTFKWNVVGTASDLVMLTFPHHRMKMVSPNFPATSSLSYMTTKGNMYPALGNTWTFSYALSTITWNPPRPAEGSCVPSIVQGLEYEIKQLGDGTVPPPAAADFYFWGGTVAAKARLALIAEAMGRTDLIPKVTSWLQSTFNGWFSANNPYLPAYETGWGGMTSRSAATDIWVDYGNGFYNDHHFHYGYFLTVAAVIAKYDQNWMNQHRAHINWFLRDIVNPSTSDPFFPVARCRDWFAGHSWASGIGNGAGSRDQESSGEAVNGYYGALLWATVTGQTDAANYARLLLATEIHGAQVYWQMVPNSDANARDQPYPEAEARRLVTMGNVQDWQAGAWLFWGNQRVQIAAIQILPVTPDKELLFGDAWVQAMWAYTQQEINDPTFEDSWKSVIYLAYSTHSPQTAANFSSSLTSWGSGNTYTNQLHFVATRPNPTKAPICSSGLANPQGNFVLQSVSNGKFVVSSGANPNLMATGASQTNGVTLNFAFAPNAGTLKSVSTSQFVTADITGNFTLAAARPVASGWEIFVVRPKQGAASGVYTILAGSNKKYVVVNGDGSLVNSGATEAAAAGFKLIQV
ncbi:glycoside hydrolase family 81 protein [Pluteus cervinus]|uniref:Glycoside hydrolase family 81 protein n=1 Tax=Pluteus cervinus TaxID=181527 RepID=A0ACD3A4U0_9AGAR|nr:glycoside hydrolase family 81 protein [Pluteus cervinus]